MSTTVATIVESLKGIKEVLGIAGVIASLAAFYAKFQSKYAIPLGIIGSLLILIWGSFERKNLNSFLKSIAWIGIVVGLAGFLFFATVGLILLLSDPSSSGDVAHREEREFQLTSSPPSNKLMGQYVLEIKHEADLVEIGVMPAPNDIGKVKKVGILTQGPLEQTDKMTLLANRTSDTETYFKVTSPPLAFNVRLNAKVELKEISSTPLVRMRVFYTYIKRGWLLEARSWIQRNCGW